jgi:hypothetical protein
LKKHLAIQIIPWAEKEAINKNLMKPIGRFFDPVQFAFLGLF